MAKAKADQEQQQQAQQQQAQPQTEQGKADLDQAAAEQEKLDQQEQERLEAAEEQQQKAEEIQAEDDPEKRQQAATVSEGNLEEGEAVEMSQDVPASEVEQQPLGSAAAAADTAVRVSPPPPDWQSGVADAGDEVRAGSSMTAGGSTDSVALRPEDQPVVEEEAEQAEGASEEAQA